MQRRYKNDDGWMKRQIGERKLGLVRSRYVYAEIGCAVRPLGKGTKRIGWIILNIDERDACIGLKKT